MGTNYYRIKEIPIKKREELHEKLDLLLNRNITEDEFEHILESEMSKHEVHICKFSFGWQVGFDHNWGKYYQPNRKSLEKFLLEPNTWIEDEYGAKIYFDDFWKMVDEHNANPKNNWTSKSYRKYEEQTNGRYLGNYFDEDIRKCKQLFGIDSNGESDFTVDGLRFAVYSDFY